MTKLHLVFAVVILTLSLIVADTGWAQGFGGSHRGTSRDRAGSDRFSGNRVPESRFNKRAGERFGGATARQTRSASGTGERFGAEFMKMAGDRFPGEDGDMGGDEFGPGGVQSWLSPGRPEPGIGGASRAAANMLPSDGGFHAMGATPMGPDMRGMMPMPAPVMARRGAGVRRGWRRGPHSRAGFYSPAWYGMYPGAWRPDPSMWANTNQDVFIPPDIQMIGNYLGMGEAKPKSYDYGNNVTYQDNSVYVQGENVGTAADYYQQANDLADTGTQAETTEKEEWLSLGVFAMTNDEHQNDSLILQLAVNKEGVLRGNYTTTFTNDTKPVHGSIDKKTQRAAFTIGNNKNNVLEAGLYDLTKSEVPVLVHFGKDRTEQWILVRLDQDDQKNSETNGTDQDNSDKN